MSDNNLVIIRCFYCAKCGLIIAKCNHKCSEVCVKYTPKGNQQTRRHIFEQACRAIVYHLLGEFNETKAKLLMESYKKVCAFFPNP